MARYQVIVAYDGTHFYGFQRQARLQKGRTVQGVFEEVLRKLGWEGRSILAAGRTDTGVHASGQVIAFDLEWAHHPQVLLQALNAELPKDVAVQKIGLTRPDFHPRFDALSRRYQYRLYCQNMRDPLRERYAWRVSPELNLGWLYLAAAQITGTHDFAAFGFPPRAGESTIRCVYQASWLANRDEFIFEIVGNAFLYRMVRRLVAAQVEVGLGRLSPEALGELLNHSRTALVQKLAPPQGLTLVEVKYPDADELAAVSDV